MTIVTASNAATLIVTSTANEGPGSLREALVAADASSDADSIVFDIPGAGTHTIRPASPFPAIHHPVVIDATIQPGYAGKPVIELDGSLAGKSALGFDIRGGRCTVRGFAINRFSDAGILLALADGCVVQGNFVGTDITGTQALPNGIGVRVYSSKGSLIGGSTPDLRNVISGNQQVGVYLDSNTRAFGNFIGTDAHGTSVIGNQIGIQVNGVENEIGGTSPGTGNLISGNRDYGILISFDAQRNLVRGNYVGTDFTGTVALGGASGPRTGVGVFLYGAKNNQIGEAAPGARNIIAGNQYGIDIRGNRNVVEGNFIGVDVSGATALPNQRGIVFADVAKDNRIGGTALGADNVISGNAGEGIIVGGANISGTQILGNRIGVDSTGTIALGNLRGIDVQDSAVDTTIGGVAAGSGNTIANSSHQGIRIFNVASRNRVQGNAIYSNGVIDGALGIDLAANGISPNDLEDGDAGPNQLQNFPELTEVFTTLSSVTISGKLFSTPSRVFDLDFYATTLCHPSGYGEGRDYLGSHAVTTDASGQVSFTASMPATVPVGWVVTATATDADGNTSEFSRCVRVAASWSALVSALTRGNLNGLTVEFSRAPDETSALDPNHFTISGGVTVNSVTRITSHKVRLETSPIAEGRAYTLTVNAVRSSDGAIIPPGTTIDFLQTQGVITRKEFDDISGALVSDLTRNTKFPSRPDSVSYLTSLEAPMDIRDNYGQQLQGFLTAPVTGDYTFYICSDDQSVLYLSTDQDPVRKQLIATEPQWNPARSWISGLNQGSRVVPPNEFFAGAFFIEAEDFDYGGGQYKTGADTMP